MATWTGHGLSQQDFLIRDTCVTVNESDEIQGALSKKECHQFLPASPAGHLHRAFSVFLFNSDNKLLLQQRASDKITFPDLWTNTCCSHQLHGQVPEEVDSLDEVQRGSAPGAVAAAIRKLEHELGIPQSETKAAQFTYITRLLYCAGDTHAQSGEPTGWGEHEMDYILFAKGEFTVSPNPEEIQATKYVGPEELRDMMNPENGLRWSPWFRIIAQNFLYEWWEDVDGVIAGKHADWDSIHKLSCE
eukprot:jgi/Ulvmu1/8669/UM047_0007.1